MYCLFIGIAAGHIDPRTAMIHSIKPARDISKEVEADKQARQDGAYRSHPYFEEDPEIDLDDDIPPPQRRIDPKEGFMPAALRRNLPEPSPESRQKIPSPKPRQSQQQQQQYQQQQHHQQQQQYQQQQQQQQQQRTAQEGNGKPKPPSIDLKQHTESDQSHQYRVLTSPVSPGSKIHRDYTKEASPPVSMKEKEYMYPSPVTPPDPTTSPPRPGSPSMVRAHREEQPQRPHSSQGLSTPQHSEMVSTDLY